MTIPKRSGKKLTRTPLLARLRNDGRLGLPGGSTRIPTLATPTRFPKYLAKQTSSGIGQTAAFDQSGVRT